MATTLNNTEKGAKRNLLSKAGLRYVGLVSAFVGISILLLGRNVTPLVLQVSSIICVLIGILLISGNAKRLFAKNKDKEVVLYLLIGVLLLVVGILLYVYGGTISKWIDIIIGSLIAVYGLIILINFCIHKRKKTLFIMDIIISCLFIATGVLLALMFEFGGSVYVTIVGIFASVTGVSSVILY